MTTTPYQILARKYRPQNFDTLIGQDAMVRTLRNAFSSGRIAQAYMLTGVRGVGKTTTARILARALNYINADGSGEPTVDLLQEGLHCASILASRHIDVFEMDAASNTGIDDIRKIIEEAHYKPISARYKVYIIDEVHMLSTSAFNGLLKTLEEPPPHVKFIFATTEIRKVPLTVLSRCQRFDLRRIDDATMVAHLEKILDKEQLSSEESALKMISRAAEGSVRDALSLLDQAIAYSNGHIEQDIVAQMLGFVDQQRVFALLAHILEGQDEAALESFEQLYQLSADPALVVQDLMRFVHAMSLYKIQNLIPEAHSEQVGQKLAELSMRCGVGALQRLWQMLVKGYGELQSTQNHKMCMDMLIIKLCYASGLPDPATWLKKIEQHNAADLKMSAPSIATGSQNTSSVNAVMVQSLPQSEMAPQNTPSLQQWSDVVAMAKLNRDVRLATVLEQDVQIVSMKQGKIELFLLPQAPVDLAIKLSKKIQEWTGERWFVTLSQQRGEQTLAEQKMQLEAQLLSDIQKHPFVEKVLSAFPGSKIDRIKPYVKPEEPNLETEISAPLNELYEEEEN